MRSKTAPKANVKTIDDYLARLDDDKRAALERLRRILRAAAPRAEECISYGMPALRLDGRMLVWFGAGANHCAFYPGGIVEAYKDDLKDYETSKGTIRFQPDDPLPPALVRKIVTAAIARNTAAAERRAASRTARGRR